MEIERKAVVRKETSADPAWAKEKISQRQAVLRASEEAKKKAKAVDKQWRKEMNEREMEKSGGDRE